MKALILSCNTGGGHNSAGRAIAEAMTWQGDEAYVMDYLTLAGEGVSRLVGDGYVQIVKKTPKLFGLVYKLGMLVSKLVKKSPVYYVNGRMAKYLNQYLKENPVDVLVMPHLYPAETITYMKRKGMKLPLTLAVMTDYTCIPFWEETDVDYYIAPHESLIKPCVRRGLPKEKLVPLGIPVSRICRREISKEAAREKLSLSPVKKYILVAGGSMGAGDMKKMVECLLKATKEEELIIICGSNTKVENQLKKAFGSEKRARILGFTTQMNLYMKACDVLFTKPGGLTSTEGAVAGIPMVHTDPIPGCETANRKFFGKLGMSVSARTVKGQVQAGIRLLYDAQASDKMRENQQKNINKMAADDICEFIRNHIKEGGA
ncbi:MGDG synthase family glycosyltransferase [Blautia sp. HCP3S3_H10_1]|uniref:MGDG synthase family glycosyltransferase n=1 Tax=unclassified Blautia TaxID=2648079 RepID=UPI003F90CA99|nr:glycosyltransferase [Clostridia bacterium]